ncbi:Protein kinase superfamily protein [Rhynchospora pubera]|uniref:Protein kinase superfamily protein n=1 Tax=Rhynchospora pubera TaxID=906938 RepID=A0AAV8F9X6_9POAL|nr:Protein kinase superfamily protein [Rhynchospora pubera]
MEFMEAAEVTDVKAIKKHGLRPHDVSKLVRKVFAEMMFKHGFVHCDPHAANLMVRPLPKPVSRWSSFFKRRKPQLILLDHGLYKELDFDTRTSYAALWKGLVFADEKAIRENSINLGAGEDLYVLFAGVLTMRPWKRVIDPSVDHLSLRPSHDDRSELQMYAAQYFPQISELLRRLPRVILLMLKTNDCLRALNHDLVEGSPLESFLIIGRVSSEAVLDAKRMINGSNISSRFRINIEHLFLEARLLAMKLAIWLLLLRNSLPLRWEQ